MSQLSPGATEHRDGKGNQSLRRGVEEPTPNTLLPSLPGPSSCLTRAVWKGVSAVPAGTQSDGQSFLWGKTLTAAKTLFFHLVTPAKQAFMLYPELPKTHLDLELKSFSLFCQPKCCLWTQEWHLVVSVGYALWREERLCTLSGFKNLIWFNK
jgi:hypothetical protein